MICIICRQAEVVERQTLVTLRRGEFRLQVSNVPARVCPDCGESYVEEAIAAQLLRIAQQISDSGVLESQYEYSNL